MVLFLFATLLGQEPIQPKEPASYHEELGRLIQARDWSAAEALLDRALKEHPGEESLRRTLPWILVEHGNLLGKGKDATGAHARFSRAHAMAPDQDYVLFHYAISLRDHKQQFQEAVRLLELGLEKFPKYPWFKPNLPWSYALLADQFEKAKDLSSAFVYRKRAFDLAPDQGWVVFHYAMALRMRGDLDESLRLLKEGARRFPDYPHFASNLPYTYHLRFQERLPRASEADIMRMSDEALNEIDFRAPFDSKSSYFAIVQQALLKTSDVAFFERTVERFTRAYPREGRVLDWAGVLLALRADARGAVSSDTNRRAMALRREARQLYDATNPSRPPVRLSAFPLKQPFVVATPFDGDAWSHVGFGKYCYDLMVTDDQGATLRPGKSGKRNEDYHTHGAELVAVADGTVFEVTVGNQDQEPARRNGQGGNQVWIQTADGQMIFYEHLKYPGSALKKGDGVKIGQHLGFVGNTGPSGVPHLHFCLMDAEREVSRPFLFPPTRVRSGGRLRVEEGPYAEGAVIFP